MLNYGNLKVADIKVLHKSIKLCVKMYFCAKKVCMIVDIGDSWCEYLQDEFSKEYFNKLSDFVDAEYANGVVYPPKENVFSAFKLCPFNNVKAVIIGQDPYHGPFQAHGLCFSVQDGVKFPPSLKNILKEINSDLGIAIPKSGDLSRWAKQGVLMLNATLTVRANQAGSHQNKGWETFTDEVIKSIAKYRQNVVYILWGSYAQKKASMVDKTKNLILESAHPSPLSAYKGFFGNHHFSLTNTYLIEHGIEPIEW